MLSLSLRVIILLIYDRKTGQRSCQVFITQYQRTDSLSRHESFVSVTMAKVSWSCVEVACCIPNCSSPAFNPKISHRIPGSPLVPQTPISACTSHRHAELGQKDLPCCDEKHKHFLYSIVLPKHRSNATSSNPEIITPEKTITINSTPISPDAAPIFTPATPPERPGLRARRDTLSKLKIPESPPLSQEALLPRSKPSSAQPSPARNNNRSGGTSMYPDMFLPTPSQSQMGAGNMGIPGVPLSAAYSMTVSPMTSAYTPLFSRDLLAMSPISPLMYSNNPSPIMGAA